MLFMAYEGQPVSAIRRRHGPALQALYHLIHDLVSHPAVFTELGFSAEQTAAARQLLGRLLVRPAGCIAHQTQPIFAGKRHVAFWKRRRSWCFYSFSC